MFNKTQMAPAITVTSPNIQSPKPSPEAIVARPADSLVCTPSEESSSAKSISTSSPIALSPTSSPGSNQSGFAKRGMAFLAKDDFKSAMGTGNISKALVSLKAMASNDVPLDTAIAARQLFKTFGVVGGSKHAVDAFEIMAKFHRPMTRAMYHDIIAAIRPDDAHIAKAIFRCASEDKVVNGRLIDAIVTLTLRGPADLSKAMMDAHNEATDNDEPLGKWHCDLLLGILAAKDDVESMEKVTNDMNKVGIEDNRHTWAAVLSGLKSANLWQEAYQFFVDAANAGMRLSPNSYEIAASAATHGDYPRYHLFQVMREQSHWRQQPSRATYENVVRGLGLDFLLDD